MLKQNTSQTFILVSLAFVLLLCSLSAFSEGVKFIEFFQLISPDMDVYTVKAKSGLARQCVTDVSPLSLETIQGSEKIMAITYLKTVHGCYMKPSSQMFEVRSKSHPERAALVWWIKEPGQDPIAETNEEEDPLGLLWINNVDGDHIQVLISYDGESR